jgi:enoyl-CoA hydratase
MNTAVDSPLTYVLADGVATITMNDGKANAMSPRMLQALNDALDRALADKAIVVLTGRPGVFSGGFDLGVFKRGGAELVQMLQAGARLSERMLSHPLPIVVACSGHAVAMGAFVLLSSDLRIGLQEGAIFQMNEVLIGMTLPHFAIEVSRQRLAPAQLNLATTTGQAFTGMAALQAGFVDTMVAAADMPAAVDSAVAHLKKMDMAAYSATKARVRKPMLQALHTAVELDCTEWAARLMPPAA